MADTSSKQTLAQTLQLGANPVKKLVRQGHKSCCLIFRKPLDPTNFTTETQRLELSQYQGNASDYFRDSNYIDNPQRYFGYNLWAGLLNREIGRLQFMARACLDARNPADQAKERNCYLSFADQLVAGLPQFFLCVWELQLNDWFRLGAEDFIRSYLTDDWLVPSSGSYKSPVDVTFDTADTLTRALAPGLDLHDDLTVLRRRYKRQQAIDNWCWLRFFCEQQRAFDYFCRLQDKHLRMQREGIEIPDMASCERWHEKAQLDLVKLDQADPGFDWSMENTVQLDIADLAKCIFQSVQEYDHDAIVEELAQEFETVILEFRRMGPQVGYDFLGEQKRPASQERHDLAAQANGSDSLAGAPAPPVETLVNDSAGQSGRLAGEMGQREGGGNDPQEKATPTPENATHRPPSPPDQAAPKPRWDSERRELWYGDTFCKHFRQPAKNQEPILASFEEQGWPKRIDDPITPKGQDSNRQAVADAVYALNKNDYLHFELDGTKEGILWSANPL
jgi:hypothetical protein